MNRTRSLSTTELADIDSFLAIDGFVRSSEPHWQGTQGFRNRDAAEIQAIKISALIDPARPNLRWIVWNIEQEGNYWTATHYSFQIQEGEADRVNIEKQAEDIIETAAMIDGLPIENEIKEVRHIVRLTKQAGRALDDDKSDSQIATIISAALTMERTRRGWSIGYLVDDNKATWRWQMDRNVSARYEISGDKSNGWAYGIDLVIECKPTKIRRTLAQEFDNIVVAIDQKANLPANRWKVAVIDGERYVPKEAQAIQINSDEDIGYAPFEVPADEEWITAFDHLYGLDDYIAIIKSTLEAAVLSGWQQRVNIALIGPPACGKSDICKSLKRLLGEEAVLEFDGTSTTMAGAQQNLAEREELPRVMLIEEIEKAPEASLPWLLSVLDLRGEVRKTTARGNILKEVHMVGICTVNNQEVFDRINSGALASRFSLPLHFSRPPREILWKILHREIAKIDGDDAWIEPVLDYAEDVNLSDPRKLIAIALTGRERLLTGEYQRMLDRVSGTKRTTEQRKADEAKLRDESECAF